MSIHARGGPSLVQARNSNNNDYDNVHHPHPHPHRHQHHLLHARSLPRPSCPETDTLARSTHVALEDRQGSNAVDVVATVDVTIYVDQTGATFVRRADPVRLAFFVSINLNNPYTVRRISISLDNLHNLHAVRRAGSLRPAFFLYWRGISIILNKLEALCRRFSVKFDNLNAARCTGCVRLTFFLAFRAISINFDICATDHRNCLSLLFCFEFCSCSHGIVGFMRTPSPQQKAQSLSPTGAPGGDGYTDPANEALPASRGSGNRDSMFSSDSMYPHDSFSHHDSQAFGAAGLSARPLQLGSPMRPQSGVPILRTGPARTPVEELTAFPPLNSPFGDKRWVGRFNTPPTPPAATAPGMTDVLGRSLVAQDGSRVSHASQHSGGSRFTEAV
ncbi:hypothetical protein P8C59_001619 [Phyllachora maydis]|uniref:Uncharacterized protein n=1 Tax=Phyllachora maydis TaxID=1825666 RepID=A0AAD9MAF4_9PEZI|nr:hypothetical protein P8C59_001619 [Phyllachora maydis]